MGDQTPLLQLVDEIARFIEAVKRVAAKRAGMKKAASRAAFLSCVSQMEGAASP
jgi:hypothetical protein